MIKDEQEAVEKWKEQMDNILNKRPIDWVLIAELERDWNDAVSPHVAKMQENIARLSVEAGLISKEEADKALAKRFNGKPR